jgi:acyl-CoA synthetase (AMP-forming)/AMP-acid ligase II
VRITDRTKDLIKSGGEWISSVDLENALMAHSGGGGSGGDRRSRTRNGANARSPVSS